MARPQNPAVDIAAATHRLDSRRGPWSPAGVGCALLLTTGTIIRHCGRGDSNAGGDGGNDRESKKKALHGVFLPIQG